MLVEAARAHLLRARVGVRAGVEVRVRVRARVGVRVGVRVRVRPGPGFRVFRVLRVWVLARIRVRVSCVDAASAYQSRGATCCREA